MTAADAGFRERELVALAMLREIPESITRYRQLYADGACGKLATMLPCCVIVHCRRREDERVFARIFKSENLQFPPSAIKTKTASAVIARPSVRFEHLVGIVALVKRRLVAEPQGGVALLDRWFEPLPEPEKRSSGSV